MKRTWRSVDGVLLFDKPLHLSSNTALQKVRRLFGAEKAGHAGTLDPLATGLLPVCLGDAAKFSAGLLNADKTYRAGLRLGWTSSTGDAEGELAETGAALPDKARILAVLQDFRKEIEQVPPMHSALKHQGKPLYEYIRQGETVARAPRKVTIFELALIHYTGDILEIETRVSKGTYIRTLAEDIGRALGCGAYLVALRRTASGPFDIAHACTLEQLETMEPQERDALLLPVDAMLHELPALHLEADQARRIAQGQRVRSDSHLPEGRVRLLTADAFIGIGRLESGCIRPERMVAGRALQAATARERVN